MKKKYIIGNWKSNKNSEETKVWFETLSELYKENKNIKIDNLEIIICPPYVLLPQARVLMDQYKLPIKLGAQDVSPFVNGPYTGEICASQISEWAEYVIIGHSERRINFHEDDKMLFDKVERAQDAGLKTVFCIQDKNTEIPEGIFIIAYEPVWAIGSGKTDSPEEAQRVAKTIKYKRDESLVIYGGSVTGENVSGFLSKENIDGVLPGRASLDPYRFWEIIVNAAT